MTELIVILPLLLVFIMLVVFRISASRVMPLALILIAVEAFFYWEMPANLILAAGVEGLLIAMQILYIVFGALLLLYMLLHTGLVKTIRDQFKSISPDPRIQVLVVAWAFGSFLEGASGFGTPAAIAAPLLMLLGFPAMAAVMSSLVIQSTPVSFGAIGTPILIGVHSGLAGSDELQAYLSMAYSSVAVDNVVYAVGAQVAILHGVIGTMIPTFVVCLLTRYFGKNRSWREGLEVLPFAVFSGLCFTIPYALFGIFLGPQFPSLFAGLIALLLMVMTIRAGYLQPKRVWSFPERESWLKEWLGSSHFEKDIPEPERKSLLAAFLPYLLVAVLLVVVRLPSLPVNDWFSTVQIHFSELFATDINIVVKPLLLPGTIFIATVLICAPYYKINWQQGKSIVHDSLSSFVKAMPVLIFAVPLVRIMIHSQTNLGGFQSMPIELAQSVSELAGSTWPLFAAVIGALGAFIAGSNTISNMTFALFQFGVAMKIQVSPLFVVALQAVGGAAGNMICIHNIVAASATCGLVGQEGNLIRKTMIPTLYYLLAAGLMGITVPLIWSQ